MGKIIGTFIGIIFGPLGMIIGFILGAIFDSQFKFNFYTNTGDFGWFFDGENDANSLFRRVFPLFASEIVKAGGVTKVKVLTVKNLSIQLFGKTHASFIMKEFKRLVEEEYSPFMIEEACEGIYYTIAPQSKIYIISILYTIIKADNEFKKEEMNVLRKIALGIGLSSYEFDSITGGFSNSNSNYDGYKNFNTHTMQRIDPYKVLNISKSASDDEIKKQYYALCKKYHPDVTSHLNEKEKKESELKMKQIISAYETIKKERNIK
jgi:DnaJ like chaperone protein